LPDRLPPSGLPAPTSIEAAKAAIMARRHSEFLRTSGNKVAIKTPTAELLRELGALGLTVEQIVPLVEVAERELNRRRLARASEDSGTGSLDELERIIRQMHDNLSARIGDEKRARRIFLDAWPPRERRIFAAMLMRDRGRPPGDGGRVASKNEMLLWLYKMKQAEGQKMGQKIGPYIFARWLYEELDWGASVEANYRKLKSLHRK
jgi:hypothetical protein